MRNIKLKVFIFIILAAALIIGGRYFFLRSDTSPQTVIQEFKDEVLPPPAETIIVQKDKSSENSGQQEIALPGKITINVPFTSQAPYSIWDERHEEACEEASILMMRYFQEKKPLTKDIAEKEIQEMINYQIKNYGNYKDSNVEQMIRLARDFYNIQNLKAVYDFDRDEIKRYLAQDNPIIIPAAGRELGNPNFTQPGPLYHALVLTGYSGNEIITNDPGTRKGDGYRYNIDVLYNAIHDFPGDINRIREGKKAMIVIAD